MIFVLSSHGAFEFYKMEGAQVWGSKMILSEGDTRDGNASRENEQ